LILFYLWFGGSGCSLNKFLISFTLVFSLIFTVISVTEWCEHGALLPSAVVTLYCYFVLFGAMTADPSQCNSWESNGMAQLIIGLLTSAFSICYAAWNLANSDSVFGNVGKTSPEGESHKPLTDEERGITSGKSDDTSPAKSNTNLVSAPTTTTTVNQESPKPKNDGVDEIDDQEMEEDAQTLARSSRTTTIFHLILTSAAMYMAMLLTNWGSRQGVEDETHGGGGDTAYNLSVETMWVKIITEWVTGILYIWTLIAPYVLTSRDFA